MGICLFERRDTFGVYVAGRAAVMHSSTDLGVFITLMAVSGLLEFMARHPFADEVFYEVPDMFFRLLGRIVTFGPKLLHDILEGVFAVKALEDKHADRAPHTMSRGSWSVMACEPMLYL